MLKFLRKYSKVLLVVFGAFLMVAFLAPQAIQQLGQFTDRKVGTIGDEAVMLSDLGRADQELAILRQINPTLASAVASSGNQDDLHWLLLTREAKLGGFYGSDGDGQAFIPEIADSLASNFLLAQQRAGVQVTPEQQQQVREDALEVVLRGVEQGAATIQSTRRAIEYDGDFAGGDADLRRAHLILAKARGVFRMVNSYGQSARLSTGRLQEQVRAQQDAATFDLVALNARQFIESVESPTEEQLQEHFEKYKAVPQGGGEYGVGYRLDLAVKLEWLEIDAPAIREVITVDPIEARTFYEKNREVFPGEYADERERVSEALRAQTLENIMTEADKVVRDAVIRARRGVPQTGEFYDLPADWADQRPTYPEIADRIVERVRERFEVEIPRPAYERRASDFLPQSGLQLLPGIGEAVLRVGNTAVPFAQAVFLAREFDANPDLGIQAGLTVTSFPARTRDPQRPGQGLNGPLYYFRILETRDAEAPTEITDAIRNRVIADERAIRAFEFLSDEAETFRSTVAVAGFDMLTNVLPTYTGNAPSPLENQYVQATSPFQGYPWPMPALQRAEVRESLLEQAFGLDPLVPVDEQEADFRCVAAESPEDLSVLIGRVNSLFPLTSERFRSQQAGLAARVRAIELTEAAEQAPFDLAALKARHDYRSMESDGDAEDSEG